MNDSGGMRFPAVDNDALDAEYCLKSTNEERIGGFAALLGSCPQ